MKTGIYVPNDSETGLDIKKYVETYRDKYSMKERRRMSGFFIKLIKYNPPRAVST